MVFSYNIPPNRDLGGVPFENDRGVGNFGGILFNKGT